MIRTRKHALATLVAIMALGIASAALSGAESSEAIKARQEAMEKIGGTMQGLGAIAKGEAPFDADVVEKNAGTIAVQLEAAAKLFPEGSDEGEVETWAKPEIWSDAAGFEKALKAAHASAVALQSVKEEAAFPPALGKLGGDCKACHQTYRRPKS